MPILIAEGMGIYSGLQTAARSGARAGMPNASLAQFGLQVQSTCQLMPQIKCTKLVLVTKKLVKLNRHRSITDTA
jgi:hypothetical protein